MKRMMTVLAMAAAMTTTAAYGHGYWLLPSSTVLSAPQFVTFDAAVSNDPFHFNHRPLQIDELQIVAPDGSKVEPINIGKGELRTTFDAKFEQKGTYRLSMYREGVRASWKEADQAKRFMGKAEELSKRIPADAKEVKVSEIANRLEAYVSVGSPSKLKTSGRGLEMVASTHPNDLVAGEPLTLQFLVDGAPAKGVEIEIVRGQTRYRDQKSGQKFTSGQDGKVTVTLPEAGMYWLDADFSDDKVSVKQAKERSLAYVLTLEVLPQ
ncbi:DUF4198 domain-containing protein [Methylobacillus gramineus]|uniref:DUF4198 domain-containing protein n=1 Tax=Methylobacillus gramineus TaxID=755169 RepID=UPI001CFFC6EC|nr:DUF4198 domain-containing protein [Methylobacillus gramineus]MCB5185247.1 DUF4198 domain-containing protein [Methylobacillus gramineus]